VSETSPVVVECAGCDGEGCDGCDGVGTFRVTECPIDFAGDDAWSAIEMADLLQHGILPVPGAALDQAAIFLDAARFIGSEQARQRADQLERT